MELLNTRNLFTDLLLVIVLNAMFEFSDLLFVLILNANYLFLHFLCNLGPDTTDLLFNLFIVIALNAIYSLLHFLFILALHVCNVSDQEIRNELFDSVNRYYVWQRNLIITLTLFNA